ncbi:MAG: hypothetical protein AB2A00_40060 [Myxococcota bacterium]
MRLTRWQLCFPVLLALGACSQTSSTPPTVDAGDETACQFSFVGDPAAEPELVLTAMGDDNVVTVLEDGSRVPMMFPPQGGRVVFIGVRARNVDPCGMELVGALRDPVSGLVRLDSRVVNLQPTTEGYSETVPGVISMWANIPTCPNQWARQDLYEQGFQLEFTVVERNGRSTTRALTVTPFCGEVENLADCMCICQQGYRLGQSCSPDGGTPSDGGMLDGSSRDGGTVGDAG